MEILRQRLWNQRLTRPADREPEAVVSWLGAVQAQDYPGAKWGLALRLKNPAESAIDQAFDEGRILRTHVMRPTWHFVAPADIRWLLALTGPRVQQTTGSYFRKMELDRAVLARSRAVMAKALRDGAFLTRPELGAALTKAGIDTPNLRLGFIILHAELEGLLCSGPRRGKQFTYALLDTRVPPTPQKSPSEALTELTRRYFASHGPATMKDFAWWSGLTMGEVRQGVEMAGGALASDVVDGLTFWRAAEAPSLRAARRVAKGAAPTVHLLPNFDEYLIAYKDRDIARDGKRPARIYSGMELAYHVVIDGHVCGSWKKTLTPRRADVEFRAYWPLTRGEKAAVEAEAERYGAFVDRPVSVTHV